MEASGWFFCLCDVWVQTWCKYRNNTEGHLLSWNLKKVRDYFSYSCSWWATSHYKSDILFSIICITIQITPFITILVRVGTLLSAEEKHQCWVLDYYCFFKSPDYEQKLNKKTWSLTNGLIIRKANQTKPVRPDKIFCEMTCGRMLELFESHGLFDVLSVQNKARIPVQSTCLLNRVTNGVCQCCTVVFWMVM